MKCRMFSSMPGFYPLDANSVPLPEVVTIKNGSRHCQIFRAKHQLRTIDTCSNNIYGILWYCYVNDSGRQLLRWLPIILTSLSLCSCAISPRVSDGLNDLLLTNCLWQKWWNITSEIKLQKDTVFSLVHSLLLTCSLGLKAAAISCPVERLRWKETEGRYQPTAHKGLNPTIIWVSLEGILLHLLLEMMAAPSDTLFSAL